MTDSSHDRANSSAEVFRQLHDADLFVVLNVWDAGSARLAESFGAVALATTSAGYAFSNGLRDSVTNLTRSGVLENAEAIVQATSLPVTADLLNGFGDAPRECAETIRLAAAVGLAGASIEDATGDRSEPIYDFAQSVDRVAAAATVARDTGIVLTARAENFLYGNSSLSDTITRLQAYAEAGADVLYAPGLPSLEAIREVCAAVDRPVNVVMGLQGPIYSLDQLREAGVRRVSLGGSFIRAAYGQLRRTADEIFTQGTFTSLESAMPGAEISEVMGTE